MTDSLRNANGQATLMSRDVEDIPMSSIGTQVFRVAQDTEDAGSQAAQHLTRREIAQLCVIEASCVEFSRRLDDAEQRCAANQQGVLSEIASLRCRLDAETPKCKPVNSLPLELLKTRMEAMEQQIAACSKPAQATGADEINDLRAIVKDTRSQMELLSSRFANERQEYQNLLAGMNRADIVEELRAKLQVDVERGLEHSLSSIAAQLQAQLSSQAKDIMEDLRGKLEAELESHIAIAERNAIASVQKCIAGKLEPALTDVREHVKKVQSSLPEAGILDARVQKIENELKTMALLLNSLANRTLHESNSAAYHAGSATDADSTPSVVSATDLDSDVSAAHASSQNQLASNQKNDETRPTISPQESNLQGEKKEGQQRFMPEGLRQTLQELANTIDRSMSRQRSKSPVGSASAASNHRAASPVTTPRLSCNYVINVDAAPAGRSVQLGSQIFRNTASREVHSEIGTQESTDQGTKSWHVTSTGLSRESASDVDVELAGRSAQLGSQEFCKFLPQQVSTTCGTQAPSTRRFDSLLSKLTPQLTGQKQSSGVSSTRAETNQCQGNIIEVPVQVLPSQPVRKSLLQVPALSASVGSPHAALSPNSPHSGRNLEFMTHGARGRSPVSTPTSGRTMGILTHGARSPSTAMRETSTSEKSYRIINVVPPN